MMMDMIYRVSMPNIDEGGKAYEAALAGPIGAAVQARRKALGMTAVQLAERTKELGYPITRVTVTKIETNSRSGKLDVSEWLVLAAALQVPPALLLVPAYPDGDALVLPEVSVPAERAVAWLTGQAPLPLSSITSQSGISDENAGTRLVEAVTTRNIRQRSAFHLEQRIAEDGNSPSEVDGYEQMLNAEREAIARVMGDLTRAKVDLWRNPKDEVNAVLWDQREDEIDG